TGLYYLRARYYDPSIGRFLNEDTVEGQIDNPLSQNLYTYVSNNPLIYTDPTGHRQEWGTGGAGGKDFGFWQKEWNSFKEANSTWYSAIDFWSMGTMSQLNDYYKISQENPWSLEHFLSAGMIFIELTPQGKTAKLTNKGTDFIRGALKTCNCFTAGTKVQTDEGEKPIEEIEVGDKVLSKDDETGEVAYKEATATFNHETDEIYQIHVGDQVIESTFNHPFYVEGKGWTFVKDLKVGDLLVQSDGNTLKIDSIELLHKHVTVYNMTVDEFHTYFVSDLGIWVHNTNCSVNSVTNLLGKMSEFTGSTREKLLSAVQNGDLRSIVNELYRPGGKVGDGGTAAILTQEFYDGTSTHLLKAQQRLKQLNDLAKFGKLGLNDLDIVDALTDDLEKAIRLFK
ncbi:polymorphic toxin-type HINT domain-containing protein, partial [Paenibacillus sp. sgz500992]|uniref:polymorphic toxin-type HINT domain-containing protein n=1 Tax=Paenibacillus sp. sgz500992 TaxID=3242476 RepID=UPI0036D3BCC5